MLSYTLQTDSIVMELVYCSGILCTSQTSTCKPSAMHKHIHWDVTVTSNTEKTGRSPGSSVPISFHFLVSSFCSGTGRYKTGKQENCLKYLHFSSVCAIQIFSCLPFVTVGFLIRYTYCSNSSWFSSPSRPTTHINNLSFLHVSLQRERCEGKEKEDKLRQTV